MGTTRAGATRDAAGATTDTERGKNAPQADPYPVAIEAPAPLGPVAWKRAIVGYGEEAPDQLLANPLNPRIHPTGQQEATAASLQELGWLQTVIRNVRTGHLVDGHLRVLEAISKGEPSVPVTYVDLTEEQERLALATLDPTAAMAGYDPAVLDQLLREIHTDSGPLQALLADLQAQHPLVPAGRTLEGDPDATPEPPAVPVTRPGDLITLGRHRLLCGDATKADDVARLLGGALVDMVWTDPPYGVNYAGRTAEGLTIQNDNLGDAALRAFLTDALAHAYAGSVPGAVWYVAAPAGPNLLAFGHVLAQLGVLRQMLVWVKNSLVMGHSDFHYRHEMLLYGWKPGRAHHEPPDRTHDSVWEVDRPTASIEHPTMKPVALVAKALRVSSAAGAAVLDPFSGSGTTLVACEQEGRTCYALEVDPAYCDVIIERWEMRTGQQAQRPAQEHGPAPDQEKTATMETA